MLAGCIMPVLVHHAVAACGGSNSTPTAPTLVKRVVTSGSASPAAHSSRFVAFSTTVQGQLDVTVSWTFASNTVWVDVALTANCSSDQFVAGTCQFVVSNRSSSTAPQKTVSVPGLSPGAYTLFIDNRGPADESLTYEVDLTS